MKISGGLGNQLFQYAAGVLLAAEGNLVLDISNYSSPSNPREFSLKRYELTGGYEILNWKKSFTRIKLENVATRLSCAGNLSFLNRAIYNFCNPAVARILSYKEEESFQISRNIGWDPYLFTRKSKNAKFLGYFQSYLFIPPEFSLRLNQDLITAKESKYLTQIARAAEKESPLVVHIRFGDYVDNSVYEELSLKYYKESIKYQMNTGLYRTIWLFSDDLHRAKTFVPIEFSGIVHTKEESNVDPTIILEAMRFGKGYVLANSTFGWWGAWLSYSINPIVIAPAKWFKSWKNPERLMPNEWICFDNQ